MRLLNAMISALPKHTHVKTELAAIIEETEQRSSSHLALRTAYLRGCAGRVKDTNPSLYEAIHDYIFALKYPCFAPLDTKVSPLDEMSAYLTRMQQTLTH